MEESDPSGRFQITATPDALPGHCFICRSSDREAYIDLGVSEEFYGAVYICVGKDSCMDEFAHMSGYLRPDKYEKLVKDNERLEKENTQLIKEVSIWKKAIDEFNSMGYDISVPDSLSSDSSDSPVSDIEDEKPGDDSGEDSLGTGEGESSESSNDENLGELRSNDEPDEFSLHFGGGSSF